MSPNLCWARFWIKHSKKLKRVEESQSVNRTLENSARTKLYPGHEESSGLQSGTQKKSMQIHALCTKRLGQQRFVQGTGGLEEDKDADWKGM